VRVGYDGPGLSRTLLKQLEGLVPPLGGRDDAELALTLGRETLARQEGALTARHRSNGGTELALRIPRALGGA
jgi:hypothetical protein